MSETVLKEYSALGESALQALARAIAAQCRAGDTLFLEGDLGAGKTTFARAFIRARTDEAMEVVSPTFMLLQDYELLEGYHIWHYDLYRLKSHTELAELGLEDAMREGITLIEWPTLAKPWISEPLRVVLAHQDAARRVTLYGNQERWQQCLPSETAL